MTAVLRVLNEEDIEGLLRAGAPSDEYEAEAEMIVEALGRLDQRELRLDRVMAVVSDVCNRMFGPFDEEQLRRRQAVYHRVAQRILEARQPP